jgi:hypothetical protein
MFPIESLKATHPTSAHESGGADKKIEVSFEQGEGAQVALRYMTWTDGLGWCCQKTIRVEQEQLDELHRALTVARHRARRKAAEDGATHTPAKVIQLPSLA